MPALATRAIASGPISGALPTPPNGHAAQDQVYVAEFVVYDLALPGTRTLRYATHAFTTRPTDNPADTHVDGRLMQPGDITRSLGTSGIPGPRLGVTFGELILINEDGALDVLGDYGIGGREVTVRRGPLDGHYPYDFPIDFVAEVEAVAVTRREVRLRLRDGRRSLEVPLQETRYTGANVPPDGLEGGDDIKGTPKPLVYGQVRNIPLVPVNTAKLIYQVGGNQMQGVEVVYDNGIALGVAFEFSEVYNPNANFTALASTYGGGLFVVAGGASGGATTTLIATSPDGTTWTNRTAPATTTLNALAYGGGVFVAGGGAGTIHTSPDGVTWTTRTFPSTLVDVRAITYGNDRFIAVTSDNSFVARSTDGGVTWVNRTNAPTGVSRSVAYSEELRLFCATGNAGLIMTSPDGVTWTQRTSNTTVSLPHVHWGNGVFVTGGDGIIITSVDGVAWASRPTGTVGNNWRGGIYVNNTHCMAENGTVTPLIFSDDAISWKPIGDPFTVSGQFSTNGTRIVATNGRVVATPAPVSYADAAALEDDSLAPLAGSYGVLSSASGTYIRLGSQPAGQLTADVTHGAAPANRTAAQLMQAVLLKAGFTSADWVASDFTALDAAAPAACGLYLTTDTAASALDRLADSVGAFWGFDDAGKFRVQQFTAPSGTETLALTDADLLEFDQMPFLQPSYRTTLRYAEHVVVQTDGLAGGVTAARRADLGRQWREVTTTDAAVQTAHLLAEDTTEATALVNGSEAATEAARRQTLRGTLRRRYGATIERNPRTASVRVGDVLRVTSARFGCAGGVLMRVTALDTRRAANRLRLTLFR